MTVLDQCRPGDLLRRWREHVEFTQKDLGHLLGVSKSTVSQWESGQRSMSLAPGVIDDALGAGGAFSGLCWALTTEQALAPSRTWAHNLDQRDSGPVWAWVRNRRRRPGRISFAWGDWGGSVDVPADGLFLESSVSLDGPPVIVQLAEPGWVDTGRGEMPEWIGLERVDAVEALSVPQMESSYFFRLLGSRLRDDLASSGRSHEELAAFLNLAVIPSVLGSELLPVPLAGRIPARRPVLCARGEWDGAEIARLRRARGMSRADVVRAANDLAGLERTERVGLHWLRAIESGMAQNQVPCSVGRLDLALGGLGHLARCETSRRCQGKAVTVSMPQWWVGPVWFELEPVSTHQMTVLICWRGYIRGLVLDGPIVVGCNKVAPTAEMPVVMAEEPIWVTAGIGADDAAVDINKYWFPEAGSTVDAILAQALELILGRHGRTIEDYRRFLATATNPGKQPPSR